MLPFVAPAFPLLNLLSTSSTLSTFQTPLQFPQLLIQCSNLRAQSLERCDVPMRKSQGTSPYRGRRKFFNPDFATFEIVFRSKHLEYTHFTNLSLFAINN